MKLLNFLIAVGMVQLIGSTGTISLQSTENSSRNATKIIRHKRYLDFIPKSRMFMRANIKANVFEGNQLVAFAYGYRANYPIENDRKIRRRDVYDGMEEIIMHHGYDGRECMLKLFCDATKAATPETGMFFRLFQLIFSYSGDADGEYSFLKNMNCDEQKNRCPLKLFNLMPYTDM